MQGSFINTGTHVLEKHVTSIYLTFFQKERPWTNFPKSPSNINHRETPKLITKGYIYIWLDTYIYILWRKKRRIEKKRETVLCYNQETRGIIKHAIYPKPWRRRPGFVMLIKKFHNTEIVSPLRNVTLLLHQEMPCCKHVLEEKSNKDYVTKYQAPRLIMSSRKKNVKKKWTHVPDATESLLLTLISSLYSSYPIAKKDSWHLSTIYLWS